MYTTLVPAYGRDYTSAKAVKADWDAGKDFVINDMSHKDDGRYINKADAGVGKKYTIRFKRLMNVCVVSG
jgi:hypothetical protein